MNVLLKEDVEGLGLAGEVYKVADGYGRNYLIPKGLAVLASPNVMKQAAYWRKKADARRAELRAEYEALAVQIEGVSLNFTARAGETGKLYGSVTTSQVTDALNETLGTNIDRRVVGTDPLRQLGEHKVVVRLSGEIQPFVTVVIADEDGRVIVAEEVEEIIIDEDEVVVVDEEVISEEEDFFEESDEEPEPA